MRGMNTSIPSDCEQWLELADDRIIDQLPSGTFQIEYTKNHVWVYQAYNTLSR